MHTNTGGIVAGSHCTCCHVCHASEKTSRREFLPCTTCTSIACRPCVEGVGEVWEEALANLNWSCPKCTATCPCLRCRRKVAAGFMGIDTSATRVRVKPTPIVSSYSPSSYSSPQQPQPAAMRLPKKRRDETLLLLSQHSEVTKKRKQYPESVVSLERPNDQKKKHKNKNKNKVSKSSSRLDNSEFAILSGLALHSSDRDLDPDNSSSSPDSSDGELENDFAEELWNFQEADRKRLEDLISRNQRCTEFIKRTEQLLRLIRTEQGNILSQLKLFRKMKGRSRTTTPSPQPPSPSLSPGPSTEVVVVSPAEEDKSLPSTTTDLLDALTTQPPVLSSHPSPTTTIASLSLSKGLVATSPSLLALSSAADISAVTGPGGTSGGSGGSLLGFAPTHSPRTWL